MSVTKQVKDAIDLVALISQNVKLQKMGANFKGLCPFHSEKTPSFYVNPQGQYFHCFGCGKLTQTDSVEVGKGPAWVEIVARP